MLLRWEDSHSDANLKGHIPNVKKLKRFINTRSKEKNSEEVQIINFSIAMLTKSIQKILSRHFTLIRTN